MKTTPEHPKLNHKPSTSHLFFISSDRSYPDIKSHQSDFNDSNYDEAIPRKNPPVNPPAR